MMSMMMSILFLSMINPSLKMITPNLMADSDTKTIIIMTMATMMLNNMMLMKEESSDANSMKIIINIISVSLMAMFISKSPIIYILIMETTLIPLSMVILHSSKDEDKKESIKFMVYMNTLGSIPFMIYATKSLKMMEDNMTSFFISSSPLMLMMMVVFLIKTPVLMTHIWLTKVHVTSSGNCSMILASIMIKMGTVGMMKFCHQFYKTNFLSFFMSVALLSSVILSATMVRLYDIKTVVAMSSVLHMSMITPFMMMMKPLGVTSSIMMMVSHGLISYFLFYVVTLFYEKSENRTMSYMKSMESKSKLFSLLILSLMFLNMGIPPFMNFFAETIFLSSIVCLNLKTGCFIFMISLLLNIIFTMQISSKSTFGKKESMMKMELMSLIPTKFLFFTSLTLAMMWLM